MVVKRVEMSAKQRPLTVSYWTGWILDGWMVTFSVGACRWRHVFLAFHISTMSIFSGGKQSTRSVSKKELKNVKKEKRKKIRKKEKQDCWWKKFQFRFCLLKSECGGRKEPPAAVGFTLGFIIRRFNASIVYYSVSREHAVPLAGAIQHRLIAKHLRILGWRAEPSVLVFRRWG